MVTSPASPVATTGLFRRSPQQNSDMSTLSPQTLASRSYALGLRGRSSAHECKLRRASDSSVSMAAHSSARSCLRISIPPPISCAASFIASLRVVCRHRSLRTRSVHNFGPCEPPLLPLSGPLIPNQQGHATTPSILCTLQSQRVPGSRARLTLVEWLKMET